MAVAVVAAGEPSGRRGDAVAAVLILVFVVRARRRRRCSSRRCARASPDPRRVARPLVREAPLEPVAVVVEPVFGKFFVFKEKGEKERE